MLRSDPRESWKLTLELGGRRIATDTFCKGISAFSTFIQEVSARFIGRAQSVKWMVTVKSGNARICFSPEPVAVDAGTIPRLLEIIHDGIETLESGSVRPPHFSNQALQSLRQVAEMVDARNGELASIRVWKDDLPRTLTARTLKNLDCLITDGSRDWGSVEGRLSMVSEIGGFHFIVVDPLTHRPVSCRFPEGLLSQVVKAFGKRVSVSGLIRYAGNGDIVSVDVDEFRQFPSSRALPGFMEVYGILGGN